MTYEEVLAGIHSRKTFSGGGPTLERIRRLMKALGDPQKTLRCIHVAGTNGKGSLCAYMDAILRECGYRVGLFTSPYLRDFRERIQICGALISKEELRLCYETVMAAEMVLENQGYEPVNEFELVTAIGFLAFSRAGLDYVVLEVGLGGKSDPTNLIEKPVVSCIMPISLDHTAILGNTLEQIAEEKAGIIKPGCPVVLAKQPPEARKVFCQKVKDSHAPLHEVKAPTVLSQSQTGTVFSCAQGGYEISLLGQHQAENAMVAIGASICLDLPQEKVKSGLKKAQWPGRLQLIPGKPAFLIDAGHNAAGIAALSAALDSLFPQKRIISIMAMMKDKEYAVVIPEIAKRSASLIGTTVGVPRSLLPVEIANIAGAYCKSASAENMECAIGLARKAAGPDDLILICGSVYAAGEALNIIL